MNADPHAIRAQVEAVLADLPVIDPDVSSGLDDDTSDIDTADIDAVGRRLEQAHQILVDALESVEKG